MSQYFYQNELIEKLDERDKLLKEISNLTKEKDLINKQVKDWLKVNNIKEDGTTYIKDDESTWTITKSTYKKRSVRDYNMLEKKLGSEYDMFVDSSEVEKLTIKKR